MRIQEMRSGFSHFRKRDEDEMPHDTFEMNSILELELLPEPFVPVSKSELDEPRWSVVSFDQIEAGGLTYRQASELTLLLDAHGITGLCLITNEAAARMNR